jgi:acetyl-CoA synthetase
VTGHSYIVYGPLANHATSILYEGAPNFPDKDRWWEMIEKYKVTILYTAPTAIRTFMKWGTDWPEKHDLSSLRLLGSVGEPINPEAWVWYQTNIGGGRCPVVDTWWQTETGMIMITPLPGPSTPSRVGDLPVPRGGRRHRRQRRQLGRHPGRRVPRAQEAWPAMLRGIYGDPERYKDTYWSRFEGRYFAGTGPSGTRTATSGCSGGSTT